MRSVVPYTATMRLISSMRLIDCQRDLPSSRNLEPLTGVDMGFIIIMELLMMDPQTVGKAC